MNQFRKLITTFNFLAHFYGQYEYKPESVSFIRHYHMHTPGLSLIILRTTFNDNNLYIWNIVVKQG